MHHWLGLWLVSNKCTLLIRYIQKPLKYQRYSGTQGAPKWRTMMTWPKGSLSLLLASTVAWFAQSLLSQTMLRSLNLSWLGGWWHAGNWTFSLKWHQSLLKWYLFVVFIDTSWWNFISQITSHGSHVRGELKTKVWLVVKNYGFESSQHKYIIKHNHELARGLKEGYNFTYLVCNLNDGPLSHWYIFQEMGTTEANRKGLFHNKNIQKVINAMWFANKNDDGITYPEYFKPMPDVTIALVLTVVC